MNVLSNILRYLVPMAIAMILVFRWESVRGAGKFIVGLLKSSVDGISTLFTEERKVKESGKERLILNKGESVIRQYLASRYSNSCKATVTVTNRRLIFNAVSYNIFGKVTSNYFQQARIEEVGGLRQEVTTQFRWGVFVLSMLLLTLVEANFLLNDSPLADIGYRIFFNPPVLTEFGEASFASLKSDLLLYQLILNIPFSRWISYRRSFALQAQTAASSVSVSLGEGFAKRGAWRALFGECDLDTSEMLCELGALLEAVKVEGSDLIYENWKRDSFQVPAYTKKLNVISEPRSEVTNVGIEQEPGIQQV